MIKTFTQKIDFSWFFLSLLGFVLVLPFSQALVSIFGGIVLGVALLEDTWKNKIERSKENRILLFIPGIFMIYLISFIIFFKAENSLYDLKKALFFLIIPIAFMLGKPLTICQKRFLFYAFTLAIFGATVIAVINWLLRSETGNFGVHKISLISHIRFSFQLILIFWFLILLVQRNYGTLSIIIKTGLLLLAFYFLAFLFFQQSLTGLIAFGASLFFSIYLLIQIKKKYRTILLCLLLGIILIPALYVFWVIFSFYDIEKVDKASIEKTTSLGNSYTHDFENPAVENGHYTYLYVCNDEMRAEWNKISSIKYDDIAPNGYPLHATLIRYLTSKGLRKDADGIKSLTPQDIQNVENGIANIIFQTKNYSLYPRIYQTVWEYYMYSKTGYPSYQSFSQRIEYAKAAITIIKNNFWFGVGVGNWKEEFRNAYISNNSKLDKGLYASSHNQYLNYLVKFGFVGFVTIMFFIVYPVIKTKSYRDPLFLIFLVFLFFANFSDSNFETHMGSTFFLFFYCLFVIQPDVSYLTLSDKTNIS
ncbi:MAG TPA: O-antigen ligase family protein [Draconibacterium sp.]|nr:O-antigen ligase family protein [Draconibacterium sp.]